MTNPNHSPLADWLRPKNLGEVIGQRHLLAHGKPLWHAREHGKLHSMILWGPPGVGKTTLGRLLADASGRSFRALSAVLDGVAQLRATLAQIELERQPTVVFIDEIHRLDRARQALLSSALHDGKITLIGATTENPSFQLGRSLLDSCRVHVLRALTWAELDQVLARAQALGEAPLELDESARRRLFAHADGDARRLLNLVEQVQNSSVGKRRERIDGCYIDALAGLSPPRFDNRGEYLYDLVSALHKSVRGSSPDAALYWMCRLLQGGVERRYLRRRLIAIAWDDIGLADPDALQFVVDVVKASERLEGEEGDLALAQATLLLACATKSNAGGMAYLQAKAWVASDIRRPVPPHLRSMQGARTVEGVHCDVHWQESCRWAGRRYLPDGMRPPRWYEPVPRGFEARLAARLEEIRLKKS